MAIEIPRNLNGLAQLPHADRQVLFDHLYEFEVTNGCGTRPCVICSDTAPMYGISVPFQTIQAIHNLKQEFNPGKPFHHYQANEALYYSSGNKTYADVAIDAFDKHLNLDAILTHGFLPTDEAPQKAIAHLTEWGIQNDRTNLITLSVDSYGFYGQSPAQHEEIIKFSAKNIKPICARIIAFYNPNDPNGNLQTVQRLIQKTIPVEMQDKVEYEELRATGRAVKIVPAPPVGEPFSAWGYTIKSNGAVIFEPEFEHPNHKEICGNIYSEIKTPLQRPIPRAPEDFG